MEISRERGQKVLARQKLVQAQLAIQPGVVARGEHHKVLAEQALLAQRVGQFVEETRNGEITTAFFQLLARQLPARVVRDQGHTRRLRAQPWQEPRQQRLLEIVGGEKVQALLAREEIAAFAAVIEGLNVAHQRLHLRREFMCSRCRRQAARRADE
ncbi:hypothetical protein FQZ97_938070 [compost metagenome]